MPPKAKKGKSNEEKQQDLLNWFHSEHDFYTLKEIEQKASKNCKISSIQIKELVTSLINEGLIEQEKCGTTNLYWSFKYNQIKILEDKRDKLNKEIVDKEKYIQELKVKLQNLQQERSLDQMPDRNEKLIELEQLNTEIQNSNSKLNQFNMINNADDIKSKIEFFNDSIETLLDYLSKKSGYKTEELRKEFNIPIELEEVSGI
ncbi:MND1 [Candida pseudojiufengensis]|uniref:MND1 n=1 Tax=Candida pseudojiufengensis TaxID=497109 RepID=UPI0022257173|nr:MND1 [Candida pseudojiufengensis]KAI5962478.1 MND1 [Candida pseudojiufengensis]